MAKKKWKKLLKKAGKAALIGGALYAATKGLKGARSKAVSKAAASEGANVGINTRPSLIDAADAGTSYADRFKYPDAILRKTPGVGVKKHRFDHTAVKIPRHSTQMQWGTGLKKGGSVTGAAKRGFGRALMKGKK